jgi:putative alpha-1,2-mannosidase
MAAGELRLVLSPKPSPFWATAVADCPPSMTGAVAP